MAEKMNKYCQNNTESIQIAKVHQNCLEPINDIIKKNSKKCKQAKQIDFKDAKALDFDCVVKSIMPTPSSVDFVIGLKNKKLLCVELKLNITETNKKSFRDNYKTKLENKRSFSQSTLSDYLIQDFVLIFCNTERLRRLIEDLAREKFCEEYKIMLLNEFKNDYF